MQPDNRRSHPLDVRRRANRGTARACTLKKMDKALTMEIGIDSFVINTPGKPDGDGLSTADRICNLVD